MTQVLPYLSEAMTNYLDQISAVSNIITVNVLLELLILTN